MSSIFENKERRVIPNFRSLKKTLELGELDIHRKLIEEFPKDDIEEYEKDFQDNQTIAYASDLLSAAIVNNLLDNKIVKEAADFIFKNEKDITIPQKELAAKILKIEIVETPKININKIDEFLEVNSLPMIYDRIKSLKTELKVFDRNPFIYSELARLYSIIGQKEFAKKNILVAKHLAPNNRYILRSFARLMAHYNEIDEAHDILRKNKITKSDPWLLASEISLASLRNKTSNLIKAGSDLILSNKFNAFSLSELASSIGTLEIYNGKRKRSMELFRTALIAPNDNSLAQFEWINNKADLFDLDIKKFKVKNNFEAITLDSYNSEDWNKTITNAEEWFVDMPFAKRPIMFGHHTASFFLEDQITAIKFCKAGLTANPNDPMIINNIAYSYAMLNDAKNAFDYLGKIKINEVVESSTQVCLLATTGLAYYRHNEPEIGRNYYLQAINKAKEIKNQQYYDMALMNFAREEILINSEMANNIYDQIMKIPNDRNSEITIMKNRIVKLLDKNQDSTENKNDLISK